MLVWKLSLVKLLVLVLTWQPWSSSADSQLLQVRKTLVKTTTASSFGAYCLDGSLPAYHLSRGFGSGVSNWLLHFEGGGWCNDVESCWERTFTHRGSSHYMDKVANMSGILSNKVFQNPDFYNWNRVYLRYCDGASFAGNSQFDNGTTVLYFRGQKIWQAIVHDLLPLGLEQAEKVLLSGSSAGGVATFLHCDNFASFLPGNVTIKCLSDAGFFLDARDIANNYTIRSVYNQVVSLQGVEEYLDKQCTSSLPDPKQCFFPQYLLKFIKTPLFVLNAAYDTWQIYNILIPFSTGPGKEWSDCKYHLSKCTDNEIQRLHDFRHEMLEALLPFHRNSITGGMYINSCFTHGQSETQDTWFGVDSPIMFNKRVAEAVGDWYFERQRTMLIDCPYPCDKTCHNLIPQ